MWVKLTQRGGSTTLRGPNGKPRTQTFPGNKAVRVDDAFGLWLTARPDFVETTDPSIVEFVEDVSTDEMPVPAYKEDKPENHAFVSNRNEKACLYELHDGGKCGAAPEGHLGYVEPQTTQPVTTASAVSVADLSKGARKGGTRRKAK